MRLLVLMVLFPMGSVLAFAPAPVPKPNLQDPAVVLRNLQGTWKMPRYELNGRTQISPNEAYTVKIEKDQWTFYRSLNGGPLTKSTTYTLKLDPKLTPAAITFQTSSSYTLLGSYRLIGDKLTVVFVSSTRDGKNRPTKLDVPEPNAYMLGLERMR